MILGDCLVASQTEGYPNCFDEPNQAESDACWCKVCDFARAIEICNEPFFYDQCSPCQLGRTPRIWRSTSCSADFGGADAAASRYDAPTAAEAREKAKKANAKPNPLAGRKGVTEERWRGDVRGAAHERATQQAQKALADDGGGRSMVWVAGLVLVCSLLYLYLPRFFRAQATEVKEEGETDCRDVRACSGWGG